MGRTPCNFFRPAEDLGGWISALPPRAMVDVAGDMDFRQRIFGRCEGDWNLTDSEQTFKSTMVDDAFS